MDTVTIGDQVWMAANLNVTCFRNGEPITEICDPNQWRHHASPGCCTFPGQNTAECGCLYNWYAINDPRGLAPEGWRIPTEEDWQELVDHLGGYDTAGGSLKQNNRDHWKSPNAGATNHSGFTALPAGMRTLYGDYMYQQTHSYYWTASQLNQKLACVFSLNYFGPGIQKTGFPLGTGASIRCLKA
ncbi:MAG: fibrobacter succinogenes major paralogous domain-containing protein [Prosthecochloris sp.]|nr:fibrobacter succinogenes major paralogous domain-containing protein [Prosthecochloris sp.]